MRFRSQMWNFAKWAMNKHGGLLRVYGGWNSTQFSRDYNKPLQGPLFKKAVLNKWVFTIPTKVPIAANVRIGVNLDPPLTPPEVLPLTHGINTNPNLVFLVNFGRRCLIWFEYESLSKIQSWNLVLVLTIQPSCSTFHWVFVYIRSQSHPQNRLYPYSTNYRQI